MAALLVSVRDAAEVAAALEGAALIDVKEPLAGAPGRADDAVRAAVLDAVAGRAPVSAALGELCDEIEECDLSRVAFAKFGMARCAGLDGRALTRAVRLTGGCQPVLAAYADWRRADAPPPAEVFVFAAQQGMSAVLLDTWGKDGSTLLDWVSVPNVHDLCGHARGSGVRVALAGALGARQITALAGANPDWFAVRGAACAQGQRSSAIDAELVRELAEVVRVIAAG